MGALVLIPIGLVALWFVAYGGALSSHNQGQANTGWVNSLFHTIVDPFVTLTEYAIKYAKEFAFWMYPALRSAETKVASWFGAHGQIWSWLGNHIYRQTWALNNTATWADITLRGEIQSWAKANARAQATKTALTKAPPIPQRRLTKKQIDAEFQKLIEANFAAELAKNFPKFDWDPGQWKKYLGIVPAIGSTVIHPHPTHPHPKVQPQPLTPGHAEPLPRTDSPTYPEPGHQTIPAVISGKDKWARGQIVTLKKKQDWIHRHLGPLALLALPAAAVATLLALLECKNFKKLLPKFCRIDSSIINWLLGVAVAAMTAIELCNIAMLAGDAATAALPALEELLLVEDVICLGGGASYPSAYIPGRHSTKIVPLSVI